MAVDLNARPRSAAAAEPAVSVIVPCYRATEYIAQALDSLHAQTFRNFETILVNDDCPDTANLERVLEPYRDQIVYLKHGVNQGPATARNTAILAARAPLIALLDSDDTWEPEYLEVQTGILMANPDVDLVYPNSVFFGESSWAGRAYMDMIPSKGEANFASIMRRECNIFIGVTMRREAIVRAGLFDPRIKGCEDFDMWLRLARAGSKFSYHSQKLVRYRLSTDSLSDDKVELQMIGLTVYNKLLVAPDLTAEERQLTEEMVRRQETNIDLLLGKKAVYSRDREEALLRLSNANRVLKNRKLAAMILVLRVWPGLLYRYVHSQYATEYAYLH